MRERESVRKTEVETQRETQREPQRETERERERETETERETEREIGRERERHATTHGSVYHFVLPSFSRLSWVTNCCSVSISLPLIINSLWYLHSISRMKYNIRRLFPPPYDKAFP